MKRNVMNDRRWMDGWPLVYDAVIQKKRRRRSLQRKEEENVSLRFPFSYLHTHTLSLLLSEENEKEKEREGEKQKLSSPLEINQLDFFSHFFSSSLLYIYN